LGEDMRYPAPRAPKAAVSPGVLLRARWLGELGLLRALSLVLRALPRSWRLALGRALGRLAFRLDLRHRRVALANLAMAYPGETETWRRRVALASFENLGRLLVEILLQRHDLPRLATETEIVGYERVEALVRAGTGYFLMSGHFGNWERVALLEGARGHPLWMITRPLDNPYLESWFAALRQSTGNRVVHKRAKAIKATVKGLKEGRGIAFVIDQDFPEEGPHFVPFFGRLASTTPALGSIAARLGVPVVPVFAYPKPAGGYRVVYEAPLAPPSPRVAGDDALAITAAATARLEQAVRSCPHAWFWMHRRWRTRPLEEADAPLGGGPVEPLRGSPDTPE
jgi:Kdo2-lipid IVA lauroyltransferase/acyltransferase